MKPDTVVQIRSDVIEIIGGNQEVIPLLDWITGYASASSCARVLSSGVMESLTREQARCQSMELPDDLVRQVKQFGSSTVELESIITVLLLVGRIMGGRE